MERPVLHNGTWLLHDDNDRLHYSQTVQQTIQLLTSYCPDMAPCNLHLFPRLKSELEEKDFSLNNELHTTLMTTLWNITNVSFQHAINKWTEQWKKCVCMWRECSDGDNMLPDNSNGSYSSWMKLTVYI